MTERPWRRIEKDSGLGCRQGNLNRTSMPLWWPADTQTVESPIQKAHIRIRGFPGKRGKGDCFGKVRRTIEGRGLVCRICYSRAKREFYVAVLGRTNNSTIDITLDASSKEVLVRNTAHFLGNHKFDFANIHADSLA